MTDSAPASPHEVAPALGNRVVLRYRLAPEISNATPGQPTMTDVIGELIAVDPLSVRGADGQVVTVSPDQVVALKLIGPRPIRTSEIRMLEIAAADAWPGRQRCWVDGWLLRASGGFSRRANSAVPLGEPGSQVSMTAETLQQIATWYTERGLSPLLAVPERLGTIPAGWRDFGTTEVLGLDIAGFVLPQGPPMVRITANPDPSWLEVYRQNIELPEVPESGREVLTAVRDGELGFAVLGLPQLLAVARGAITTAPDGRRWIGLTCVSTAPQHRRHGLATLVCAELIRWGADRGATQAYVQVQSDNPAALALFTGMGFAPHHRYRYATQG